MMRLHCDRCDAVIKGRYYEVNERATDDLSNVIVQLFSAPMTICPKCFKEEVPKK